MKKVTDLNAIKDIIKTMLYLTPKPTEFPFIIDHPIFQSPYWGEGDNLYNIMESEEGLQKARLAYEDRIDRTDTPLLLMYVCRSAYYLTFLKMTRNHWAADDFAEALSMAWIEEENPNGDVNVPVSLSAKWFREANKESLMELDEFEKYLSLPDKFKVYRGVATGRNPDGMSWTDNFESAEWFAKRFRNDGYIIEGIAEKKDVLAYFNRRNEDEVLIPADMVRNKRIIKLTEDLIAV